MREKLSPREEEVMLLICVGKSNGEIGVILDISTLTVKNHVQKILKRLGVTSRTQAAVRFTSAWADEAQSMLAEAVGRTDDLAVWKLRATDLIKRRTPPT